MAPHAAMSLIPLPGCCDCKTKFGVKSTIIQATSCAHCMAVAAPLTCLWQNVVNRIMRFLQAKVSNCPMFWLTSSDMLNLIWKKGKLPFTLSILILFFVLCPGFVKRPKGQGIQGLSWAVNCHCQNLLMGLELLLTFWHHLIDCSIFLPVPCSCHDCGALELSMWAAQVTLSLP